MKIIFISFFLCFVWVTCSFAGVRLYRVDDNSKYLAEASLKKNFFTVGSQNFLFINEGEEHRFSSISKKEVLIPKRKLMFTPNDPFYSDQWGLDAINWSSSVDFVSENSLVPEDVIVVVMDSGVAYNHPDLRGNILTGGDFGNYGFNFCLTDGINNDYDYIGHGTHVSGVISALTDNNFGIAGINGSNVKILNLKVTCGDELDINFLAELLAFSKIIQLKDKGYNIKFVNMSFGGDEYSEEENLAVKELIDNGIYPIAAAGNDGKNIVNYPAGYESVISVGATDEANNMASFSNFGDWVDIFAPGYSVISTYNDYLAKPESLNLMEKYQDFYRNEFDGNAVQSVLNGVAWTKGDGESFISLDSNSVCDGKTFSNFLDTGVFDTLTDFTYNYSNVVLIVKLPFFNTSLKVYWSVDNQNWTNFINQSGGSNSYFYIVSSMPQGVYNKQKVYMRVCFEGRSGTSAFVDAFRVSASKSPDAFAHDFGTSMATPFVTGASAFFYSYKGYFDKSELISSAKLFKGLNGEYKILDLYSFIKNGETQGNASDNVTDNSSDNFSGNGSDNNTQASGSGGGGGCAGITMNRKGIDLTFLIALLILTFSNGKRLATHCRKF